MRRNFAEIRNSMQISLAKRPMGLCELSNDTQISKSVLLRHLSWLSKLGIVVKRPHPLYEDGFLYTVRER